MPGSGRSLIDQAAGRADVFVTGDVGYHDAERVEEAGLALIAAPHGELEWYALRRWIPVLSRRLANEQVTVTESNRWRSPWSDAGPTGLCDDADSTARPAAKQQPKDLSSVSWPQRPRRLTRRRTAPQVGLDSDGAARLYVDGGSRGNPGKSAIGVVLQDERGELLAEIGRTIGIATNNVAEYRALLTGLGLAGDHRIQQLEVFSDSELLVKQILGQYRVKNEGLQPLYEEAKARLKRFRRFTITHVPRREERPRRQTCQPSVGRSGRETRLSSGQRPRFARAVRRCRRPDSTEELCRRRRSLPKACLGGDGRATLHRAEG